MSYLSVVRTDEGDAHLQFLFDISLVPCPAERELTRDGSGGPVYTAAEHVNLKGVRARCACSRHVACNMVGSASVDDGWSGQSDHSGKTALNFLKVTRPIHNNAQQSHHLQCFQMDVPPVAQRVPNNCAGQWATFYFHVSTLAICESMSRPRVAMTPEELSCFSQAVCDFTILTPV